ncbi:myo-inositol-1(or 4)-monophosphatase [Chryseobacterium sp. H1D6B]|uniref:inositol monophosphatase family protein n=1 Tax=Chryseobacterium sp. H1D6B TaxID=2940588 RepID=UPI0015C72ED7|nr:inositol monophosphatase family protein [Chryseobacterium sp. H1D6B]MDH6253441.1 myo-inositol-1(or 4)-monophosphatase [Chryseobacterium sp. H1D6B]
MKKEINIPLILDAVKKAGESFLIDYKKNTIPNDKKELLAQLEAIDEQCLSILKGTLQTTYPDISWNIGDEFDSNGQKQPLPLSEYWLCDAMDGAVQYLQHIPGWTINLALIRNGEIYFSVIYDPLAQEMFWAQQGTGAFMNNEPIQPSTKKDPEIMLAIFEYGHQEPAIPGFNQKHGMSVTSLLDTFGIVRNYGPHGLQLAYIGAGRIDVFLQLGLDTYNWLAGILIAKEAGVEILNKDAQPWKWGDESLLVAAPGIADRFMKNEIKN